MTAVPGQRGNRQAFIHSVLQPFCSTPARVVELSTAKAVLVPHPGQSYNPTFEDHQALLSMAVKLEESLKREEERIAKQLPRLVGYAAKQRALMQELSEGVSWLGRSRVPAADPSHKSGVARSVS